MSKFTGVSSERFCSDKPGLGRISSDASTPSQGLFLNTNIGVRHAEGWDSHRRLLQPLPVLKPALAVLQG